MTDGSHAELAAGEPLQADIAEPVRLTIADDPPMAEVHVAPAPVSPVVETSDPALRLTSPGVSLGQVKEELVAWVKTLMSAAVYAV